MKKYLLILLLAGCAVKPVVPAEAPPVVEAPVEQEPVETPEVEEPAPYPKPPLRADWPNPEWSEMTAKAIRELGGELLRANPVDFKEFCSNPRVDPISFYVMVISAMSRFESGFKPATSYTEGFKDAKGKLVISRGLLQLSQESANGYGCNITDAKQLHDPETNLRCTVRILNRWVARDKRLGGIDRTNGGAARYWSVMRAMKYDSKKKTWVKKTELPAIKAKVQKLCS